MLVLTVNTEEAYDEEKEEFVALESVVLRLEHSLVSLSKWEAIWEKPFLSSDEKTDEETFSYIETMCLDEMPSGTLDKLTNEHLEAINNYINAKMTATWFNETPKNTRSAEVITAELVYYWMIALGVPFECQHWHLNRLLTLIQVCNVKNSPPKKVDRRAAAERQRMLNAERKARMKTNG